MKIGPLALQGDIIVVAHQPIPLIIGTDVLQQNSISIDYLRRLLFGNQAADANDCNANTTQVAQPPIIVTADTTLTETQIQNLNPNTQPNTKLNQNLSSNRNIKPKQTVTKPHTTMPASTVTLTQTQTSNTKQALTITRRLMYRVRLSYHSLTPVCPRCWQTLK